MKWIYGFLPVFVNYKELDQEVKNFASGCKIVIEPKYECDEGILHHEMEHVRQWYTGGFFIHGWRYRKSRNYRLICEVRAYLKQMKYPRCDGSFLSLDGGVERLMWTRYSLNITKDQAYFYFAKFKNAG